MNHALVILCSCCEYCFVFNVKYEVIFTFTPRKLEAESQQLVRYSINSSLFVILTQVFDVYNNEAAEFVKICTANQLTGSYMRALLA